MYSILTKGAKLSTVYLPGYISWFFFYCSSFEPDFHAPVCFSSLQRQEFPRDSKWPTAKCGQATSLSILSRHWIASTNFWCGCETGTKTEYLQLLQDFPLILFYCSSYSFSWIQDCCNIIRTPCIGACRVAWQGVSSSPVVGVHFSINVRYFWCHPYMTS